MTRRLALDPAGVSLYAASRIMSLLPSILNRTVPALCVTVLAHDAPCECRRLRFGDDVYCVVCLGAAARFCEQSMRKTKSFEEFKKAVDDEKDPETLWDAFECTTEDVIHGQVHAALTNDVRLAMDIKRGKHAQRSPTPTNQERPDTGRDVPESQTVALLE